MYDLGDTRDVELAMKYYRGSREWFITATHPYKQNLLLFFPSQIELKALWKQHVPESGELILSRESIYPRSQFSIRVGAKSKPDQRKSFLEAVRSKSRTATKVEHPSLRHPGAL